jgi:hypothetical protein
MLPSGMDGVHTEVNALVLGMGSINMHDPPCACLQEVSAHPVVSFLTWQLFKLPATVPTNLKQFVSNLPRIQLYLLK